MLGSAQTALSPRIAVIVGSNRQDSLTRKLAQALIRLGAGKFDASFVRIDDLPMFNRILKAICCQKSCVSKTSWPAPTAS